MTQSDDVIAKTENLRVLTDVSMQFGNELYEASLK